MNGLTAAYKAFLATLACLLISACSPDVEQVQSHKPPPQRSYSSSIVTTLDSTNQETTLLHYASPEENVSSKSETYVF